MAHQVAATSLDGGTVKVLILEDDRKLASFLARVVSEEGLVADVCARGREAIVQAASSPYDLIILDWVVPETDGLSACREIRAAGVTVPILMLTARGETRERVLGLEAGADDYVVKPFELDELIARIRALLRRTSGFGGLRCGDLEIDRGSRQASLAGAALTLTNREYMLLLELVHRADQTVKRSELLAKVWGIHFDPGSNIIEVHVSRLREKLGPRAWMIETVRGVGYRMRRWQAA
jgi:DNA-binding response OmpR family regulator